MKLTNSHKYLNAEGWNNSSKESLFLWTCLHHSSFNKIQTDSAYIKKYLGHTFYIWDKFRYSLHTETILKDVGYLTLLVQR